METFRQFSSKVSLWAGSPAAFAVVVAIILAWALVGPFLNFSDTWQLIINTATNIICLLMVFLIQNTQNRDAIATHLKLDELIKAIHGARNRFVDLEDASDEELEELKKEFQKIRQKRTHVKT